MGSVAYFYRPALRKRVMSGDIPQWLLNHSRRRYIEQVLAATPPWVVAKDLMAKRIEAMEMTERTGIRYVCDHVVPLTHPHVCGLNVPWNLRVVPHWVNAAKGNKWHPEQIDWLEALE